MIRKTFKNIGIALVLAVLAAGSAPAAYAAGSEKYEVSGWIPYWASAAGANDAARHLDKLDVVLPFGYSVKTDGTLSDLAQAGKSASEGAAKTAWQSLFKAARNNDAEIIPTVMWSSGADMERILSDKASRAKHVKEILNMVKKEKFDGVNIDYEGKLAETKDDFSVFLKELKKGLGTKILACAIEARTPPDSLYRVVPANIQYSNDFKAIGRHCDQVQIMAYDQGRADWKLNSEKAGSPYVPVADKDWVRKVIELAQKDIPAKKIVLGVATYGREYEVTVSPNSFREYRRVQSLNQPYALMLASAYGITPSRNKAGEISFSYAPYNGTAERNALIAMLPQLSVPPGTPSGDVIAQKALAYANATGRTTTFNLVWWSDAQAIEDKLELVREFGLRGLAIFKIDAEEDPALWSVVE